MYVSLLCTSRVSLSVPKSIRIREIEVIHVVYSYGVPDSFHFTSFHLIESLPRRCQHKYRSTPVNISYPILTRIRTRKGGGEIKKKTKNCIHFFHNSSPLNNYFRIEAIRIIFPPSGVKFILLLSSNNHNILMLYYF